MVITEELIGGPRASVYEEDDLLPKKKPENEAKSKKNTIAQGFSIRTDQYMDIQALCAYNRLKGIEPNSPSACVQRALDLYLKSIDPSYKKILDIL